MRSLKIPVVGYETPTVVRGFATEAFFEKSSGENFAFQG
jgi:hypothetical protein